jgi:hypothetical protein
MSVIFISSSNVLASLVIGPIMGLPLEHIAETTYTTLCQTVKDYVHSVSVAWECTSFFCLML